MGEIQVLTSITRWMRELRRWNRELCDFASQRGFSISTRVPPYYQLVFSPHPPSKEYPTWPEEIIKAKLLCKKILSPISLLYFQTYI